MDLVDFPPLGPCRVACNSTTSFLRLLAHLSSWNHHPGILQMDGAYVSAPDKLVALFLMMAPRMKPRASVIWGGHVLCPRGTPCSSRLTFVRSRLFFLEVFPHYSFLRGSLRLEKEPGRKCTQLVTMRQHPLVNVGMGVGLRVV